MDIERIKNAVEAASPAPLHLKLRQAIREQIQDGTLQTGESLPSERQMKDYFGVSRATVRQAVNTLIQEGFLQSVAGTGTFVLEQPTRPTSTGLIGLVTSSPNFNFFYPQLTAAFNQRIRAAGYGLVMSLHNEQAAELDRTINELLGQNVIALAITPPRFGELNGILERLRREGVPVVFIGRSSEAAQVDVIATDNESIGYQATRHLIELGHERIVHVGLLDYSTGRERADGYRRAMSEANLQPHIVHIQEEAEQLTAANGTAAPREHLAAPAREIAYQLWNPADNMAQPTAAFCFNDIVAMGVYKGLRNIERRIPGDVSLISVDNLIAMRHFEVPLTTFALPGEAIGVKSAEILLRRLSDDRSAATVTLLPAEFIPRASTRAL